jgi:TetR/AcrR family fatty acid metabolism transcriptional regulator
MILTPRTKKEVVTEFRCSEILNAARTVFAQKGYAAATVDEIAELAGVAKGTVYCYFPSKFDVFVGTLRQGMLHIKELTCARMDAASTAAGKVRAFIRARLEYGEENRDFFRIYFTEFSNMVLQPSPVRQEFQDVYDQQARMLEQAIVAGIEAGEVRPVDALRAAYVIYEVTRSTIAHRIQGLVTDSVEESEQIVFDLIWGGLACR